MDYFNAFVAGWKTSTISWSIGIICGVFIYKYKDKIKVKLNPITENIKNIQSKIKEKFVKK